MFFISKRKLYNIVLSEMNASRANIEKSLKDDDSRDLYMFSCGAIAASHNILVKIDGGYKNGRNKKSVG